MPDSATPWTVACQASLSKGFSRQEYWNGLPFPSPKRSRAKANRVLPREYPLPTAPEMTPHMDFIRWWNTKIRLIIFFADKDGEALHSQQKMGPRADCDSDHELLIAKFRLKLKKVGKTTKPFRYDLNQIPYDYTVDMTNRFKGLDPIDRVPEELIWTGIHNIVQEAVIITIPKKKKCKKQNGCLRRPYK